VFYTKGGTPYSGHATLHGSENTGLSGWYGDAGNGQKIKLETKKVENFKVQDLDLSFLDHKATTWAHPNQSLFSSTGKDLEIFTKNQDSPSHKNFGQLTPTLERINNSILALSRESGTIIVPETRDTGYTRLVDKYKEDQDILDCSYFAGLIGIDMFVLMQNKSSYGHLLNFHRRAGNEDIVSTLLSSGNIMNLAILRRRVSGYYNNNNKCSTPTMSEYPGISSTPIISSSDSPNGDLHPASSPRGEIEQITVVNPLTGEYSKDIRSISFKDFDMFHNLNSGTYTYDISITVKDGIPDLIKNMILDFQIEFENFLKYSESQMIPSSPKFKAEIGNYNYDTNLPAGYNLEYKFDRSTNFVDTLISKYEYLLLLTTGDRVNLTKIRKSLLPNTYNIEIAKQFLVKMKTMINQLNILSSSYSNPRNNFSNIPHLNPVTVAVTNSAPPGFIKVVEKTNIFYDAFRPVSVMANLIPPEINNKEKIQFTDIITALGKYKNVNTQISSSPQRRFLFGPNSFVEIKKSKYAVDDDDIYILTDHQAAGMANYNFSDHVSISKTSYSPGHKINIMSREEYQDASINKRLIFDSKIAALSSARVELLGLEHKPPEFFPSFLHANLSGISLFSAGFSKDLGPEVSQNIISSVIESAIPDTTDEIKEAIIKSMFIAKDRDELESHIESNFKELISIKETLGSFFGTFNKFLGLKNKIVFGDNETVSYKHKFLEDAAAVPNNLEGENENRDIFESGDYYIMLIVPGIGKYMISEEQAHNIERLRNEKSLSQYAFIKFKSLKGENIAALNDAAIVRV
jgi:hypothetical protein